MLPINLNFLVNLALNLALKIHQKSTQEAPKINKKSIKNNVQDMILFFIDSLTLRVVAVDPVQALPNHKKTRISSQTELLSTRLS